MLRVLTEMDTHPIITLYGIHLCVVSGHGVLTAGRQAVLVNREVFGIMGGDNVHTNSGFVYTLS